MKLFPLGLAGVALFAACGCNGAIFGPGPSGGAGGNASTGANGPGSGTANGPSGSTSGSGTGAGTGPGSGTGGTTSTTSTGTGTPTTGGIFEVPEPWTKDVSGLSPSANSSAIIGELAALGGWGNGNTMQIDFDIALLTSDASTPMQTITADPGGYCYNSPDCDAVPLQMPLPANGNTEGSANYVCDTSNNDCHVLVRSTDQKKLYELYQATKSGTTAFTALGAFVWDLTKSYPDNGRGEQCTSADAAGFPIGGLLATADEVAAGDVHHALRFILPNARMKAGVYVHPASHAGGPTSGNANAPPYGVRFRLKASFDETPYNAGEKVILHAMKTYGMLLSDGGNIALTFGDDRLSTAKWSGVGISAQSFHALAVTDFEVVDLGPEITLTYDCVLNP